MASANLADLPNVHFKSVPGESGVLGGAAGVGGVPGAAHLTGEVIRTVGVTRDGWRRRELLHERGALSAHGLVGSGGWDGGLVRRERRLVAPPVGPKARGFQLRL